MSRLLHPLHRSARARGTLRHPALLPFLAVALCLVFTVPAIAAQGAASQPSGMIAGVISTGTDNAQNHWVAVRFSAPATVTGGQVTLTTGVPELDFECPKAGTTADPNDYTQWAVAHYFQNTAAGTMQSPIGCTQAVQVVRWIVDIAYPTPGNPVALGQPSHAPIAPTTTTIPPTATTQPATATPLPPTATPRPPTVAPTATSLPTATTVPTLGGTPVSGLDNAGNRYAGLSFASAVTVTSESVTLATAIPVLDFACPTTTHATDANFADNSQWLVASHRTVVPAGKANDTSPCPATTRIRWAVDAAFAAPGNPAAIGSVIPTSVPPTATPRPPTATPLPPTATPLPTTAPPATGGVGVCNGVADDTADIQASLNNGGVTTVKAGSCIISSPLNYGTNTTLQGAGQDVTTIKNRSGLNGAIMLQPAGGARVSHFTVKNLTFDAQATANEDNKFTVNANATSYFTSDHVTYRHVMQMAIWTDGAGTTATDHMSIDNSRVTEAFGDGFSFFGEITDSSITNSEVTHCMDDAIAYQEKVGYWGASGYPRNITITGNNVHDCTERNSFGSTANGINVYGSDNVTVSNNRVTNVVAAGLNLSYGVNRRATNIHASNNTIDHAGYNHASNPGVPPWGIKVENADSVNASGNTIVNCEFEYRNVNSTNVTGFPWTAT